MKMVRIFPSLSKPASPAILNNFSRPCDGILAATVNSISDRRSLTFGGIITNANNNSATLGFVFKNDRYKEIKYTRAFGFESLVGNVGGYIGLFLGFAIWQLPDAIEFLTSKFHAQMSGKTYLLHVPLVDFLIRKWVFY